MALNVKILLPLLLFLVAMLPLSHATFTTPSGLTLAQSISGTILPDQTEVFTASFSNGAGPFTYNFQVVNSITYSLLANYLTSCSLNDNVFSWYVPGIDWGNTFIANVIVTDTEPTTVNSLYASSVLIGATSTTSFPIIIQSDPLQSPPSQQYSLTIDSLLAIISIILFILAFYQKPGSMPQIGLYIVALALMFFGINITFIPANISSLATNSIIYSGSTSLIIQPYTINATANGIPAPEQIYIKEAFLYIYIATCLIFLLAGVIGRLGEK